MRVFGQLLLVDKQKVPYLYKITSKEFEFLHKSYATVVAMETMTFQDGGYFGFPTAFSKHLIGGSDISNASDWIMVPSEKHNLWCWFS
jgi:hypothetical protein